MTEYLEEETEADIDLESYEELGISCHQLYKDKDKHRKAVQTLYEEIASSLTEGEPTEESLTDKFVENMTD